MSELDGWIKDGEGGLKVEQVPAQHGSVRRGRKYSLST